MSSETPDFLPKSNREVSELLFAIEVGLRELIIEMLSESGGTKWHKTLLPSDVTEKYLRGRKAQLAAKWSSHVEHHPLYYIDFPDLAKVLNTNWKKSFSDLFGAKEVFLGSLKSLEPIRNSLAHNRKVSEADVTLVRGVFSQFSTALGERRFYQLVETCSVAPAISELMDRLSDEIDIVAREVSALESPRTPDVWESIWNAWWFDDEFLTGTNDRAKLEIAEAQLVELEKTTSSLKRKIEAIREDPTRECAPQIQGITKSIAAFFDIYRQFCGLPRGRGLGHKLEAWLRENSPLPAKTAAQQAIRSIKDNCNE